MFSQRRRSSSKLGPSLVAWFCLVWPLAAFGHGWHNATLTTSSLADWLSDVKTAVPDVLKRLDQTEMRAVGNLDELKRRVKSSAGEREKEQGGSGRPGRAGVIDAELSPQQRALLSRKANDCLEALAFMTPDNIFPEEFPKFPMEKMDQYRQTATKLLAIMGKQGTEAVANELRSLLMGMGRANNSGLQIHPDYFRQLLDLLRAGGEAGDLTLDSEKLLREAAAGVKPPPFDQLAEDVLEALDDIDTSHANLARVAEVLASTDDPRRKQRLLTRLREHLPDASLSEVLGLLDTKPERSLRQLALVDIQRRLGKASVLELMQVEASVGDPALERSARLELAGRSPRYADVKNDLDEIVKFAQSDRADLAKAAQRQIANAYQRAPMGACLTWLGKVQEPLRTLTWTQIDGRIARADRRRLSLYRDVAVERLQDAQAPAAEKQAALELLERLDPALAVGPLVEILPQLPRELWPPAGDVLRRLTHQDFGPRAGDGAAELSAELKKWRTWIEEHAPKDAQ
ncbi:MAG TPA: hypothetical protein VHC19_26270 [Pirellulales bacterium]|nr:hypothetical protein [Pirellulales bacterium]